MTGEGNAAPERTEARQAGGDHRSAVDLARVRGHIVDLLSHLDRPPRTIRVQAGEVSVDITWDQQVAVGEMVAAADSAPVHRPADLVGASEQSTPAEYLCSPGVGVFYHAAEPGAEPFVAVGSVVRPGQQIGIIEAMKLMIPVEAERGGRVVEVLKPNGEPVEYGEPLFALAGEDS